VDRRLLAAYRRAFPKSDFVALDDPPAAPLQTAGAALFAGSLPGLFRPSVASFARQPLSVLKAAPERVALYRGRLGPGFRVALSWRSQRAGRLGREKSVALADFAPLFGLPGVQLVDVQYGDTAVEREACVREHGASLAHFDDVDCFRDLDELLAILEGCDLLITTSNSSAHLAAALGTPVWLLYPAGRAPFHYWASAGDGRCLWYPSVEIVTGPQFPDWPSLIRHVAHRLDVADLLEALPLVERLVVWDLVRTEREGEILLEVSDAVRETLIAHMDEDELVAATGQLDTDEIADLAPDLPREVIQDVFRSLSPEEREELRAAMSYGEGTVGALMDFDMISIREDVTLEVVLDNLRRLDEMPDHTDQLFVVGRAGELKGLVPVNRLLVNDTGTAVTAVMEPVIARLHPEEKAQDAAGAFERYDLVSAPVVDGRGKLIARVTVNAVMDYIREETDSDRLSAGGLREDEDLFASVWSSIRNRWTWLAVNLVTAFVASRVIGLFENSISKLVALAALMPIVAGISGNSGNQTTTMIVRALALGQISGANARMLFAKEAGVSAMNGLIWGGVVGLFAFLIYHSWQLGLVMMGAMVLSLLLASVMGVAIPLLMQKLGRDPALGSSVMITAITDSGGFFIFLGLATVFLV
jgi:magnesium transporter